MVTPYICHATAASAALAVQQVIARDNLLDAVKQQGAYLHKALREVLGSYRMSVIRADAACLRGRTGA